MAGCWGKPRRARENTIEAFALAREDGADGVELDVHRSADGALVVHHDAEIEGFGVLADRSHEEIVATFPWLPTLPAVLDECAGLLVNIEIKNSPKDADFDPDEAVAAAVVELLASRAGADRVLVSSFHLPTIDAVHGLDPTIRTGYLTVLHPAPLDAVAVAVAHGHAAVHPFFGTLDADAAPAVAAGAHASGVAVNTWTVNEPDDIARLAAVGIDAIVTDVPAIARAALT